MASTLSVCKQCSSINRVESGKTAYRPVCGKCGRELPMHGLATEVSADGLKKVISKSDKPVLVDFWAGWCGYCKQYLPIFEHASTQNPDAIFLSVNTDENAKLSREMGIHGLPTTIVFKNGKEYRRQSGLIPEELIPKLYRS